MPFADDHLEGRQNEGNSRVKPEVRRGSSQHPFAEHEIEQERLDTEGAADLLLPLGCDNV